MGGFLESNRVPLYVEIGETAKAVRPLAPGAKAIWQHKIPGVKAMNAKGQVIDLRKFASEICIATNRSGAGCFLCQTEDPFWARLEAREQYTQKGKVQHFGKSPTYLLPVRDTSVMDVRILKGPMSLFKDMAEWADAGKDVMAHDWEVSKKGSGIKTEYKCVRQDASLFTVTDEMKARVESILEEAKKDFEPSDPNFLKRVITGESLRDAAGDSAPAAVPGMLPTAVAGALAAPPPPPPQAALPPPNVALLLDAAGHPQKDPSGFYALTTASGQPWKLITDLKAAGVSGAELL